MNRLAIACGDAYNSQAMKVLMFGAGQDAVDARAVQASCKAFHSDWVDPTRCLETTHHELECTMEWATGLAKYEAEDLLDWLESQRGQGQVQIEPDQSFAVRCPGFQVDRDSDGQLIVYRRINSRTM